MQPSDRDTDPLGYAPGTGRRLKWMAGGLIALLLAGYVIMHLVHLRHQRHLAAEALRQAEAPTPVELVTARSLPAGQPLTLPGETAAWYDSTIHARVSGYVGGWTADIGDHVKRGQVLATIETPELDADLQAAKAKLRAAEAAVALQEAESAFAETTYARWRDSPKGVVSEQEREEKKAQFQAAQARLTAARAQVNVDQAELERLQAFEGFKQVTAPYDGTITERRIDIGNLVTAGSSAQTSPLYKISKTDPIRVFVELPQSAAADLNREGVGAEITAKDLAGRRFTGKITRTSQAIDPHARTFRAEIDLPNPDSALLPGMYVQIAFQLANPGTIQVPAAALIFRASGPQLAVVDAAQHVHFVPVSIARDDGGVIELDKGVAAGDRLVLNIGSQINEGDLLQVTSIDGKPVSGPGGQ